MNRLSSSMVVIILLILALAPAFVQGIAAPPEAIEISLAGADVTFRGEEAGDKSAYSVAPAGDVNGDGYADVLVAAPLAGNKTEEPGPSGEGKAYLILGRPKSQWPADHINLADADAVFLGCRLRSMTGRQNYTAGDVNGDGYDDFLVSGWLCGDLNRGKGYLFLGRPEIDWGYDFPVEGADASFLGENEFDQAATYVHTAGDVNGDGYDDFLFTSPQNSEAGEGAGQVYLFLGKPQADWGADFPMALADASFLGEAPRDRAGRSASGVGDVNGDGYDDFLIEALWGDDGGEDAGEAYLILGRAAADWGMDYPLAQADASFIGEAPGDEAGRRVEWTGDVNGDGYADLLLAASLNDDAGVDAGKAYLILGGSSADWGLNYPLSMADATFLGEAQGDQAGRRISGAGDVNHDGLKDLLICSQFNDRGGIDAGTTYLLYGRPEADWGQDYPLSQADVMYTGEAERDAAGYGMAPAGDVDGNGVDDLILGAPHGAENGQLSGQTYLVLSPGAEIKIVADDGQPFDWFGYSVWVSGDTAVVGAYEADVDGHEDQGAAYIFYRNEGGPESWGQVAKLIAADGAPADFFGRNVSIAGDTVVVGAYGADVGGNSRQGAAYVFYRDQGGPDAWGQITKVVAADGAPNDHFGVAVHVDGDTIVAGVAFADVGGNADQGAAYVFDRNEGGPDAWGQVAKLTAADGAAGDTYGRNVSTTGDTAIIGAYLADIGSNVDQGAAYVYYRAEGGPDAWGQVAKLTADDGGPADGFGTAVPVEGDVLVVGAGHATVDSNNRQGAAYVFYRNLGGPDNWGQVAKIVADDGAYWDHFGIRGSLSADTFVAAAWGADVGGNVNQGAAYVFGRNEGGPDVWGQVAKFTAADGAEYDFFGSAVGVSGNTVISGAPQANIGGNEWQGAAYLYTLDQPQPPNTLHVAGISMRSRDMGGGRYAAYATTQIRDHDDQRVEGATVTVEWQLPDGSSETQQGNTNLLGQAKFRIKSLQAGLHQVCVTDVVKPGWLYDPDSNVETCDAVNVP